jgi:hypothetical protein
MVLSALGYAFLGAGPSLWALGLGPGKAGPGAACGMKACSMKHKDGEVCLCLLRPELLGAADGECAMRARGCGHEGADHGSELAPLRPHLRPLALGLDVLVTQRPEPALPFSFVPDFVPSPLERPPQA